MRTGPGRPGDRADGGRRADDRGRAGVSDLRAPLGVDRRAGDRDDQHGLPAVAVFVK